MGEHGMKIAENDCLKDVCVLHGDSVDFMACEEAQVSHPDMHC
jgi:hypothetical protein